jgi:hypothetical protein
MYGILAEWIGVLHRKYLLSRPNTLFFAPSRATRARCSRHCIDLFSMEHFASSAEPDECLVYRTDA